MKAALLGGVNKVVLGEVEVPRIAPSEVLVRMRACGVCGTDIEKIRGHSITPPILGHEVAGDIVEVGSMVEGFGVSDRVMVHHHVSCNNCYYCRRGDHTVCETFQRTNLDPGGLAEYFRVPELNVRHGAIHRLPEGVSYEEGALAEPTACCIRAIARSGIQPGDSAIVMGCGPVGLTHIQLLRALGVSPIIATDIIGFRLEAALRMGADAALNPLRDEVLGSVRKLTDGRGVDHVVVATGSIEAARQGISLARRGGRLILFGAPPRGGTITYDLSDVFIREISIIPSYSTTEVEVEKAFNLIQTRRIDLASMITHRYKLDEIDEAIRQASEGREALKVIVQA